jgi:cyclic pyranopterin phosphate synthase
MNPPQPQFSAKVITISTRCAAGQSEDVSGPLAVERLRAIGLETDSPSVCPDDRLRIAQQVLAYCDFTPVSLLFLTGGTGPTPDDATPQAIAGLLDRRFEGVEAAIHATGRSSTTQAPLSRVIAGARNQTIVISVPGSPGGVRDALTVLEPLLPHLLSLTQGKQHPHES